MGKVQQLTKKVKRQGFWKTIEEVLVKHIGATGYAVQGFLDGLILHVTFWGIQKVQGCFVVDDETIECMTKIVGFLDVAAIVICSAAGIASLCIHLFYDLQRARLKEKKETEKIYSKFDSLPGKTAKIAKDYAEDIESIEVEDEDNA